MSSQPSSDPSRVIPLADAPSAPEIPAETPAPQATTAAVTDGFNRDPINSLKLKPEIVEAISKVFDPEIPVNVYELGLIYDIDADATGNVRVRMTLTAPACPSAQTIPLDVERRVREVAGV